MAAPIDFSDLSLKEVRHRIGELTELCFRKNRLAVFFIREDGVMTVVPPTLILELGPVALAENLLKADWNEEQIEEFLEHLDMLREKYREKPGDQPEVDPPQRS